MPNRRTMELIVIVSVLLQPALHMVNLWMKKHIVTTGNSVTADAARVVEEVLP